MVRTMIAVVLVVLMVGSAAAQEYNFPDRKAIVMNTCPHVELSGFSFSNEYADRGMRSVENLTWKNLSSQPLSAFEIVILKYDAFDQRALGSRWTVTGKNSADWRPLQPGESSKDGTREYGTEEVMTAIAYVRAARLGDGTVWRANELEVMASLKKLAPGIKDFGSVKPDPKVKATN